MRIVLVISLLLILTVVIASEAGILIVWLVVLLTPMVLLRSLMRFIGDSVIPQNTPSKIIIYVIIGTAFVMATVSVAALHQIIVLLHELLPSVNAKWLVYREVNDRYYLTYHLFFSSLIIFYSIAETVYNISTTHPKKLKSDKKEVAKKIEEFNDRPEEEVEKIVRQNVILKNTEKTELPKREPEAEIEVGGQMTSNKVSVIRPLPVKGATKNQ